MSPSSPAEIKAPPTRQLAAPSLGVYVHFPYCLAKCPYCDFLSVPITRADIPQRAYTEAVLAEVRARAGVLAGARIHSVFFGGGTPSLWEPRELGRVLRAILELTDAGSDPVEVTAECNPSSFDDAAANGLAEAGVNRISLGVQGLHAERLAFLGRLHDRDGALAALATAQRHGFPRVSADLIFGVAGETAAEAAEEARIVAQTGVSHVSAYALTIEPGTRFGELARRQRLPLLPEEAVSDSFLAVEETLQTLGFRHYEISNYARPGNEARHNLGYWRGEPYVGLGAGAWGTLPRSERTLRYRNTPAIERYLAWSENPGPVELERESPWVATVEALTPEQTLSERLLLGLRLSEGVDLVRAEAETGAPVFTRERRRAIDKWLARGALNLRDERRLSLNPAHWLLADGIIAELM